MEPSKWMIVGAHDSFACNSAELVLLANDDSWGWFRYVCTKSCEALSDSSRSEMKCLHYIFYLSSSIYLKLGFQLLDLLLHPHLLLALVCQQTLELLNAVIALFQLVQQRSIVSLEVYNHLSMVVLLLVLRLSCVEPNFFLQDLVLNLIRSQLSTDVQISSLGRISKQKTLT